MRIRRRKSQEGQAIVIVAAIIVVLVILGALVFDVGLAMSDRRNLQAYADASALAGSRSYTPTDVNAAHWVAMQYLTGPLGFSLPTGSCSSSGTCPAATYTVTGYTIQLADSTLPGWFYPTALDVVLTHQQPSIFSRIMGFTQLTTAASARSALPGPQRTGAAYALAAVSGDAAINGGGSGIQTVTGPVYANGNFGANNGPHSTGVPGPQTNYDGTPCLPSTGNAVNVGGSSNSKAYHQDPAGSPSLVVGYNQPVPNAFDNTAPTSSGPSYTTPGAAKDGLGHWKPGIYNGFAPNGGLMNGGVYKIINTANPALGAITNTMYTASGTADPTGAVAIVLDSSDTGALDIHDAVLNGLDDLYPANYHGTATRDPMGTHNFVIYGGNGATGFAGTIDIGPHATTDLSGIVYLPKVTYTDHGATTIRFTGSVTFASMTSSGTADIKFSWVCGLNAVQALGNGGGLIR